MLYLFKREITFASALQVKKHLLTASNCKSIIKRLVKKYNEFSNSQ